MRNKKFFEHIEESITLFMQTHMEAVALKQALEVISRNFEITEDGQMNRLKPLSEGEVTLLRNGMAYVVGDKGK